MERSTQATGVLMSAPSPRACAPVVGTGRPPLAAGVADGAATISVAPGAEDVNRAAGTDDITVSTFVAPTPLAVTLE